MTEELWAILGNKESIHLGEWPKFNETKIVDENVTIVVQVNGKVRGSFVAKIDSEEDDLIKEALKIDKVNAHISAKNIAKTIYIPNKLINIVA